MGLCDPGMNILDRLDKLLDFLEEIDGLKKVNRRCLIADRTRSENDAEHTWHTCMFAIILWDELSTEVDLLHALKMLLVHDIVEIDAGDTFAYDEEGSRDKPLREQKAAERIFGILPEDSAPKMFSLWEEFEEGKTAEARFALGIDKLQAVAQNVASKGAAWQENGIKSEQVVARNSNTTKFDRFFASIFERLMEKAKEGDMFTLERNIDSR